VLFHRLDLGDVHTGGRGVFLLKSKNFGLALLSDMCQRFAALFTQEALWPANGRKRERDMQNELDRIPPGLWAPLPIPAIKYLARIGHRPASRILYAIVLHKGKSNSAIFPSYKTLRLYANVGENSIRECLDVLEKYGFIKITKSRSGKKNQNRYEILDKAYNLEINPKSKAPKAIESMICNTCWEDVSESEMFLKVIETWEGQRKEELRHKDCLENSGYGILIPVTDLSRQSQRWNRSLLEIDRAARRST
jgi:hypothetical protein